MNTRRMFLAPTRVGKWPRGDLIAWEKALNDDPLEADGREGASGWRPATRRQVEVSYGIWLSWLQERGRLDAALDPEERISVDRLRDYLAEMRWSGYSEQSSATRLLGLSSALKVLSPDYDSRWISRAAGRIIASAPRTRSVSLDRSGLKDMLDLAGRLMRSLDVEGAVTVTQALDYRDGLILALLLHRPLRVSNLAGIEINRHLMDTGSGYLLAFEGSEMKSHRPYECDVPSKLTRPLRRYIADVRPLLQASALAELPSQALWLGIRGEPMRCDSVANMIRRRTRAVLETGIGPHRVRHIAATLLAEEAPERTSQVGAILGHIDPRTSEHHYVQASAGTAAERLGLALLNLIMRRPDRRRCSSYGCLKRIF